MLQSIIGLFSAFEEGLALAGIAGRHENDPGEMTRAVQTALAGRRAPAAPPLTLAAVAEERVETREPEKAAA